MPKVRLYQKTNTDSTIISNRFIDEYMLTANDAQLKVYLFLARQLSSGQTTSISDMAELFNDTEKDIKRALIHWEKAGLMALEWDEACNLIGIRMIDPDETAANFVSDFSSVQLAGSNTNIATGKSANISTGKSTNMSAGSNTSGNTVDSITNNNTNSATKKTTNIAGNSFTGNTADSIPNNNTNSATDSTTNTAFNNVTGEYGTLPLPQDAPQAAVSLPREARSPEQIRNSYTPSQIQNLLMVNGEPSTIIFATEMYVGHPLSNTELRTICYIKDVLGFNDDLVDALIQYCVERGKKDFRYIEKVAISWKEQGITTPSEALSAASRYHKEYYTIMNRLGRNSAPTEIEMSYITRWLEEYSMELEVVCEACDRTVLRTDSNRFRYAEGILESWHKKGIRHLSDIERLDAPSDTSANNGSNPANTSAMDNSGNNTSYKGGNAGTNSSASGRSAAKTGYKKGGFNQFQQNDYDFDALEKQLLGQED